MHVINTFVETMRCHAATRPNGVAYTFLDEAGAVAAELSYAQLDTAARALAARLQRAGAAIGDRVLILQPTGPDFVCAFFGVLYAGAAAMPLAFPRAASAIARLDVMLRNGQPRFGLVHAQFRHRLSSTATLAPALAAVDLLDGQDAEFSPGDWSPPLLHQESLALIQYTSGSTTSPRGVMVSHGNLLHNEQMMSTAFRTSADSVMVSWLPLFHDMGLIGNMLHSAWLGSRCVLFAPTTFLRDPFRWLEAVSRFAADFSGGPNFAYDFCTQAITQEHERELDLTRWRIAFNGSEPVRAETLTRFARRFAAVGFSPRALYPCYGLAEATLFVSGGAADEEPRRLCVSVEDLALNRARQVRDDVPGRTLVSCGRSWDDQKIEIVDVATGRRAGEGAVGEIWIAGPSVASGYFVQTGATAATFGARLDGVGPFLRTGDLGFLHGGELFITGRLKDLIVIRGRNHHPQDIEQTVEKASRAARAGSVACFSIDRDGEERLVVVQELAASNDDWQALATTVRNAIFAEHEVHAFWIVLVKKGSIPKTSSGKLQRGECRAKLLAGELSIVFASRMPQPGAGHAAPGEDLPVVQRIRRIAAQTLKMAPNDVPVGSPLVELGLDSLSAAILRIRLQQEMQLCGIGFDQLLSSASVLSLAAAAADHSGPLPDTALRRDAERDGGARGASAVQQRLWFLEQLAPGGYHIPFAIEIDGPLDAGRLRHAIDRLLSRHEALRTSFHDNGGKLELRLADKVSLEVPEYIDASVPSRIEWARQTGLHEATIKFDAACAPLMRARLLTVDARRHVLVLVLHHLVADGWSVGVISRDLARLYHQAPGDVSDVYRSGPRGSGRRDGERRAAARAYWRENLSGVEWSIDLPRQRPRHGIREHRAIRVTQSTTAATKRKIREFARAERVTAFMVTLAAFTTLLHCYSGQTDLAIGTIAADRADPASHDLVGPLFNTIVLRLDCSGNPTFRELVRHVRTVIANSLEHADLPFDEIMQELAPRPQGPAPFQVMAVYQNFDAEPVEFGLLKWRPVDLDLPLVPFDLTFSVRNQGDDLSLALDADADQFDEAAARGVLVHIKRVIDAALNAPETPIARLSPWIEQAAALRHGIGAVETAPVALVHEMFSRTARRAPQAPAVTGAVTLTYSELDNASNGIAQLIRSRGVPHDGRVGVHIDDAALRCAALIGILKAGAAYLPLETGLPDARLRRIISDARPAVVLIDANSDREICQQTLLLPEVRVLDEASSEEPKSDTRPEHLAYVVYTSGSTGDPVGVAVPHGAIAQHCRAIAAEYALSPADRVLQFASISFDVSAEEMFPTWSSGGAVVTIDDRTPSGLQRVAMRHAVTVLNLPSRYWELWASEIDDVPAALRLLVVGSESVSARALADFRARFPHIECRHAYGVSEAAVTSTVHRAGAVPVSEHVPIGQAIAGTRLFVLDRCMQPVGAGGQGELYLAGAGLGRCYLNRPAKTAEQFVPNPFAAGKRLFRTGDIVRCRWDGEFELLGRRDGQLKISGHRIEPGEVEEQLRRAGAREAIVATDGARLIAYVERGGRALVQIRQRLAEEIPRYMVPTEWIETTEWPRLASGKVDRRMLAKPTMPRQRGSEPIGVVEQTIAGIYGEILKLDGVTRETDFFSAGGHSLLAMQTLERIRRQLHVELPVRAIFEAPTVWELAEQIPRAQQAEKKMSTNTMTRSAMKAYPLTAAQRRLWFLDTLAGATAQYNMPMAIAIRGPLDEEQFARAFDQLIDRHEVLRSVVADDQARPGPRARLAIEPAADWPHAQRRAQALARAPFDIARGPLIRATLLRVGATERLAVIVVHHLVSDGRSLQVMLSELGAYYRRQGPTGPPLWQYGDYAVHDRGRDHQAGLHYWKAQLENSEPVWLPYDGSANSGAAGRLRARLPVTTGELEALGRRAGVTVHMILLAAVEVLLHRYSGDEDIRTAVPVANRPREELHDIVGCLVNTLVIRTAVRADERFIDYLQHVKKAALDAYDFQDTPFDAVVAALRPGRGAGTPLIEVMLLVEPAGLEIDLGAPLKTEVTELENGAAKFDLTITIRLRGREVEADLEYDEGRFERATAEAILQTLQQLIESVVRDPEQRNASLRILSTEAEERITRWECGGVGVVGQPLHRYVEDQARRTPDRIAIECGPRALTYRRLIERANQVARGLQRRGVGAEALVGLRLGRNEDLIVAMLGVLKAGAAYVPIDPEYPLERQRYIEHDSRVSHMLTGTVEFDREDSTLLPAAMEPDRLAYVIYTSGSEGRPKGVGITHRGASALLEWVKTAFSENEMSRVMACTSACFDLSVYEIYGPLALGGTVVLVDNALQISEAENVTLVNTVPSAMARILKQLPASVVTANLAGEVLPRSLVDELHERGISAVWNLYGPTEDTTYSSAALIARGERGQPQIGRPLPGTWARVLDAQMARVPPGARGELYLAGAGLARGYVNQPSRTAERFVPDPHGGIGTRTYRTGDWVRYRPDGALMFLGRRDAQVKVRGYRIEPAEVEDSLRAVGAKEAVVMAQGERLVAYVETADPTGPTAGPTAAPSIGDIRRAVGEKLPKYLVPSVWIAVEQWLRTPSGKIDRKRLPRLAESLEPASELSGATETAVAGIFSEVLGIAAGRNTNFFEAGGHSLLAMQVVDRIRRALGVPIQVRMLFEAPTVWELAERIDLRRDSIEPPVVSAGGRRDRQAAPLTAAQRRLWFMEQMAPGTSRYHVPFALTVRGPLDIGALAETFNAIVARHEILRTAFPAIEGVPIQRVAPSLELPLSVVDLGEHDIDRYIADEVERPFALDRIPLFRISVIRSSTGGTMLLVVMHHIICDEWSLGILLREFAEGYLSKRRGEAVPQRRPLVLQVADYAEWEASPQAQAEWQAHRGYWATQLRDLTPVPLPGAPVTGPRPPRGEYLSFLLEQPRLDEVHRLARSTGATPAMVLHAAYAVALHRYSGATDIAVGMPVAGRRPETEPLIGFFVNQLVMRIRLAGSPTFTDVIGRVREAALDAYAHQDLPFDEIVAAVQTKQPRAVMPLVNVQFDAHNAPFGPLEIGDMSLSPQPIRRRTVQFDLQLSVEETARGLECFLGYNAERISALWAQRFADDFAAVVCAAVAVPSVAIGDIALAGLPQPLPAAAQPSTPDFAF